MKDIPEPLRNKYFQTENNHFVFHPVLRRSVIFGRHDLVDDAPIPHLDLLVCRNTLMYFNAEAQARVLTRLHFAIEEHGFLFLGRAEMLLSHGELFTPMELRHRVFTKAPVAPGQLPVRGQGGPIVIADGKGNNHARALREAALDAAPVAQIVVDGRGRLAMFNQQARALFRLGPQDVDQPLQDLEISYRPLELRSLIDQARDDQRGVVRQSVEHRVQSGEGRFLDVQVTPLHRDGTPLGVSVTFQDVTDHQQMQGNLQRFAENLETAYEELQSANEELETTNEELQSANEELETTNEELQSANEEMETMNEELRSTNDELTNTNDQLRQRDLAFRDTNASLRSILEALNGSVVVLGTDLKVQVWNGRSSEMWGLRSEEVEGQDFLGLDVGLPVKQLEEPLRGALRDHKPRKLRVTARNRRGREIDCRILISPIVLDSQPEPRVLMLVEEWGGHGGESDGAHPVA
jgi:two-component system CheB/CheR fusion protein